MGGLEKRSLDMVEKFGIVEQSGHGKARVRIKRAEKCAGYHGCQLSEGGNFTTLEVVDPVGGAGGDRVKIQSCKGSAVKSGFILHIMSLIALFFGYLLGSRLVSRLGGSSTEGWRVISAFLFMALTYLVVYLLQNRFSRKRSLQMQIVQIVGNASGFTR